MQFTITRWLGIFQRPLIFFFLSPSFIFIRVTIRFMMFCWIENIFQNMKISSFRTWFRINSTLCTFIAKINSYQRTSEGTWTQICNFLDIPVDRCNKNLLSVATSSKETITKWLVNRRNPNNENYFPSGRVQITSKDGKENLVLYKSTIIGRERKRKAS